MTTKRHDTYTKIREDAVEAIIQAYLCRLDLEKLQTQLRRYDEFEVGEVQDSADDSSTLERQAIVSPVIQEKLEVYANSLLHLAALPENHVSEFSSLSTARDLQKIQKKLDNAVQYIENNRKEWMKLTTREGFEEFLRKKHDLECEEERRKESMKAVLTKASQLEQKYDSVVKLQARMKELAPPMLRSNKVITAADKLEESRNTLESLEHNIRALTSSHKHDIEELDRLIQQSRVERVRQQEAASFQFVKDIVKREITECTASTLELLDVHSSALAAQLIGETWQRVGPALQLIRSVDKWHQKNQGTTLH